MASNAEQYETVFKAVRGSKKAPEVVACFLFLYAADMDPYAVLDDAGEAAKILRETAARLRGGNAGSLLEWLEDFNDPVAEVLRIEVGMFGKQS